MNPAAMIARFGVEINLLRATVTRGEAGGRVSGDPSAVKLDVKAWMQPASSVTIERYMRRGITVTHRVYVAQDLGAVEGDVLAAGDRRLAVRGVRDVAGLGRLWELDCEETI